MKIVTIKSRVVPADDTLEFAPPTPESAEYHRRNLLHAASVGAVANAGYCLKRLRETKSPPKWLIKQLEGILERAGRVSAEMALHRNEIKFELFRKKDS